MEFANDRSRGDRAEDAIFTVVVISGPLFGTSLEVQFL